MKGNFFISAAVGAATGLLNGLFGSGGGTVAVPCLERFLDVEEHKAHASAIAIILPLCIVSVFVYMKGGGVSLRDVVVISIGGMAGGFMGAKLLSRISGIWLHRIFGAFMLAAAVKMIL